MMKSLFFALFAVFGTIAYSASISWGTDSTVKGPSGSSDWSGGAFLYMVERSSGSVPSWSKDTGWAIFGATFIASGNISQGEIYVNSTVDQNTQFKPEGSGYYYVIVYTSETADSLEQITKGAYAISDKQELFDQGSLPGSTEHSGELLLNEGGTLDWNQMSVPEPTVLALLALGVAGIALKRRVA